MAQKTKLTEMSGAAELLKDPARLKSLMSAPETKQLMDLLRQGNGAQLKQAAAQAKEGDSSALSEMLRRLSQSGEGAKAMERLQSKIEE